MRQTGKTKEVRRGRTAPTLTKQSTDQPTKSSATSASGSSGGAISLKREDSAENVPTIRRSQRIAQSKWKILPGEMELYRKKTRAEKEAIGGTMEALVVSEDSTDSEDEESDLPKKKLTVTKLLHLRLKHKRKLEQYEKLREYEREKAKAAAKRVKLDPAASGSNSNKENQYSNTNVQRIDQRLTSDQNSLLRAEMDKPRSILSNRRTQTPTGKRRYTIFLAFLFVSFKYLKRTV